MLKWHQVYLITHRKLNYLKLLLLFLSKRFRIISEERVIGREIGKEELRKSFCRFLMKNKIRIKIQCWKRRSQVVLSLRLRWKKNCQRRKKGKIQGQRICSLTLALISNLMIFLLNGSQIKKKRKISILIKKNNQAISSKG